MIETIAFAVIVWAMLVSIRDKGEETWRDRVRIRIEQWLENRRRQHEE